MTGRMLAALTQTIRARGSTTIQIVIRNKTYQVPSLVVDQLSAPVITTLDPRHSTETEETEVYEARGLVEEIQQIKAHW